MSTGFSPSDSALIISRDGGRSIDWRAAMQSTERQACSIDGCDKPRRSSRKTVCEMHYCRYRRNGSYELKPRVQYKNPVLPTGRHPRTDRCPVEDCGRNATSWVDDLHVCLMHWKRWKRRGSFDLARRWNPRNPNPRRCAVDGCAEMEDGWAGLCKLHDTRNRRHGDPLIMIPQGERDLARGERHPHWTGDDATYEAMHQRIRYVRGSATKYACVDCGKRAAQWSYDHACPDERPGPEDKGPYSTDMSHYFPRCASCHRRFDLTVIRDKKAAS